MVTPATEESWESDADFLLAQLQAIVDALWEFRYRPEQALWDSAKCPWCRRMLERGIIDDCPICSQFHRSRTAGRTERRERARW
jgi:hypothetical protein